MEYLAQYRSAAIGDIGRRTISDYAVRYLRDICGVTEINSLSTANKYCKSVQPITKMDSGSYFFQCSRRMATLEGVDDMMDYTKELGYRAYIARVRDSVGAHKNSLSLFGTATDQEINNTEFWVDLTKEVSPFASEREEIPDPWDMKRKEIDQKTKKNLPLALLCAYNVIPSAKPDNTSENDNTSKTNTMDLTDTFPQD